MALEYRARRLTGQSHVETIEAYIAEIPLLDAPDVSPIAPPICGHGVEVTWTAEFAVACRDQITLGAPLSSISHCNLSHIQIPGVSRFVVLGGRRPAQIFDKLVGAPIVVHIGAGGVS